MTSENEVKSNHAQEVSSSSVSGMTIPDVAIVLVHSEVKSTEVKCELTLDKTNE